MKVLLELDDPQKLLGQSVDHGSIRKNLSKAV